MSQPTVIKSLIGGSFLISIFLSGCNNSANTNSNKAANNTINQANSVPSLPPISAENLATKTKIEEALKKAGFTDIIVDATTTPITIRGTVPGDKMAEVNLIALQAAGKQVNNEIKEKK